MHKTLRTFLALIVIASLSTFFVAAQPTPVLTDNTEYVIGTDCPEAQTLSPDGTVLWVLMLNCAGRNGIWLTAYSVTDGSMVAEPIRIFDFETQQKRYIDRFTHALALTADGNFSIRTIDSETYTPISTVISPDGSEVPTPVIDDAVLNDLLLTVSEYPESAIYSYDHTRAAITGTTALTVFDLTTGEALLSLPVDEGTNNAFPSFSTDGQTLYVSRLDNYEDMEDYATTVTGYNLTDGSVTGSFAAPSFIVWVSPDGKFAAVESGSNDGTVSELAVIDTATGAVSETFSLYEPSRKLMTCTNDGRDMSVVDFTVSGTLQLIDVNWLPDSSGFVVTRSYGGEGAFGGCTFDTSRMNVIMVGGG